MKKAKPVIIAIAVLLVLAVSCVYVLAKKKIIFLNTWFVNEENYIFGVDISSYQADVDMEKLKSQGVEFVYIKASEGSSHEDSRFAENWENAKSADLPAGAYHFFSYDSSGITQAENFIEIVGEDLSGRLLPAVDVEYYADKEENPPEKEAVVKELQAFIGAVEEKYNVKPIIYTRPDLYEDYLEGSFDDCEYWISSIYSPISWNFRGDWYIWQYLNRGELEGYTGGEKYIDLNVINRKKSLEGLFCE
ncbi:MAG: glycoside hydrolase family 25 [Lachnospiraceae bacterium]|nr:glycoside hydrolase family 25 [Lachnospiraceae bacterium]